MLGGDAADGIGEAASLSADDLRRDEALRQLYDGERRGGLGASAPRVARWLGDIRGYFPSSVVQVMQADAMDRLGLTQLLLEPEMLEAVQPDINLVSTLRRPGPGHPRAVHGDGPGGRPHGDRPAGGAAARRDRPGRHRGVEPRSPDPPAAAVATSTGTAPSRANLKHYQPEHRTVIPERLVGHARRSPAGRSATSSCASTSRARWPSPSSTPASSAPCSHHSDPSRTRLVVFDTQVVDLTEELDDPVDVLFGVQLGGGTDINQALAYCESLITQPNETILVLISDLYEGGIAEEMLRRAASITGGGATMIALLALSDSGRPSYDADHAAALAAIGVPAFACTPDQFPDLMATAIERRDIAAWAAANDIVTTHGDED